LLEDKQHRAIYHFAFNIPNNQVKEGLAWAAERFKMISLPDGKPIAGFDNWHASAFYFYDHEGNILEFLARHDLPNASDQQFSETSILGISEIAVVTDDVRSFCRKMRSETSIPDFAKQPPHDNFSVLGNDEGLIIVSETGRHWYPTEICSEKALTKVRFQQGGNIFNYTFNG
jgi:hypothetical protein